MTDPQRPRVPAVARSMRVLEVVAAGTTPMTLADIARAVGIPKSTVMGICHALSEETILTRGADGSYGVGPRLFELAAIARVQRQPLRRIGYCYPSNEPFFLSGRQALLETAVGAQIETRCAEQDVAAQVRDVIELIDTGVDLVLVDPVASDALGEAVAAARRARVPIVAVGSTVAGTSATVTTDNTKAGALVAGLLARHLGGRGRVAIVDGIAITANADRIAGFLGVLRQYPRLRLVGHFYGDLNTESGVRAAADVRAANVEVDAFFAVNDQIALGLSRAFGSSCPPIVSVDGVQAAVEQIRCGGTIIGTAAQNPAELMRHALELGLGLLSGTTGTSRTRFLTPHLVDRTTVQEYRPWG